MVQKLRATGCQLMNFKSQKNQIRQILEDRISNDFKNREVCVWLSGGADSTLIALICKSLGKKVTSISYHLDGITNWDCEKAEEISDKNGFDFHKVIVPFDDPKSWFLKLITGCVERDFKQDMFIQMMTSPCSIETILKSLAKRPKTI